MADYAVADSVREIQAASVVGEEVDHAEGIHLMLEGSQAPLLGKLRDDPLPHMAEWRVAEVMSHADGPGELCIKAERAADGGGDGSHVQHMLHAGADMVIGGGEEDLRLMLEPPEGR